MIVVDASFAYALLDRRDAGFAAARSWYDQSHPELITTPLILAEVDHLALRRLGRAATAGFRADVARGAYRVSWWEAAVEETVRVAEHYGDLGISLADASLIALAGRLETTSIATFDERHFRAVQPLTGEPAFTVLPVDAP